MEVNTKTAPVHLAIPQSETQSLLQRLSLNLTACRGCGDDLLVTGDTLCNTLDHLRLYLRDSNHLSLPSIKDEFRRLQGFEILIDVLRSFAEIRPTKLVRSVHDNGNASRNLLDAIFAVLSEALVDHPSNERYFAAEDGLQGWMVVSQIITSIGTDQDPEHVAHLFGILFAFALREESFEDIFCKILKSSTDTHVDAAVFESCADPDTFAISASLVTNVSAETIASSTWRQRLSHPAACRTILDLLQSWRTVHVSERSVSCISVSVSILTALRCVCSSSRVNAVAMHAVGLVDSSVKAILDLKLSPPEKHYLKSLTHDLLKLGFHDLSSVFRLLERATTEDDASQLLLEAIQISREPPQIYFDLSSSGFAAVELEELAGEFPAAVGYTFTTWLFIEEFDNNYNTTIFAAFDTSRVCFLLLYLDRKSHHLTIQTSITPKRITVLQSVTFLDKQWYHIAIVHRSNQLSLIVDGQLCEQIPCQYPQAPKLLEHSEPHAQKRYTLVHAFMGTPKDLSPRLGEGYVRSKWAFASAHLISDVLPQAFLLVAYHLGPHYHGNFQDTLGSYLTYSASTKLSLRTEELPSNDETTSLIGKFVKSKAGKLISEASILLSLSPYPWLDRGSSRELPKSTQSRYYLAESRHSDKGLMLNAAIPHINIIKALPGADATVTGGATIYLPSSIASDCFRLTGCVTTSLEMVANATTRSSMLRSVRIFFELIAEEWRNSEAMERTNGFGLLAWLLEVKFGVIKDDKGHDFAGVTPVSLSPPDTMDAMTADLLQMILTNLGFNFEAPQKSVVTNPMGYRLLIIDCDVWHQSGLETQALFLKQFNVLTVQSSHSRFNLKRISQTRSLRKVLDNLTPALHDSRALELTAETVMTLLTSASSSNVTESLKLVALFITHTLNTEVPYDNSLAFSHHPNDRQIRDVSVNDNVGATILMSFTDFLCQEHNKSFLRKFSRAVTNKWVLNLLASDNSKVIGCATRIIARLLLVCGPAYMSKFKDQTKGFLIMRRRLRGWWHVPAVRSGCLSIFWNVSEVLLRSFDSLEAGSVHAILDSIDRGELCSAMWPVLCSMFEHVLSETHTGIIDESSKSLEHMDQLFNFLLELHVTSPVFRDFCQSIVIGKDLLKVLCHKSFSILSRRHIANDHEQQSDVTDPSDTTIDHGENGETAHINMTRTSSSYAVLASPSTSTGHIRFSMPLAPREELEHDIDWMEEFSMTEKLQELLVCDCVDQIVHRKEFAGLGLYLKVSRTSPQELATILSFIVLKILQNLEKKFTERPTDFLEPKTLMNLSKFFLQSCEAVFEGWLLNIAFPLLKLIAAVLLFVLTPEMKKVKSVRLCEPFIEAARTVFCRLSILQLSCLESMDTVNIQEDFILSLIMWRDVLLAKYIRNNVIRGSLCYLLLQIVGTRAEDGIQLAAVILLQEIVRQNHSPGDRNILWSTSDSMDDTSTELVSRLKDGREGTAKWIRQMYPAIQKTMSSTYNLTLKRLIIDENSSCEKSAALRQIRRSERISQIEAEMLLEDQAWNGLRKSTDIWNSNVCGSESLRLQRMRQDQQDNNMFLFDHLCKLLTAAKLARVPMSQSPEIGWNLDEAEGRDRMRIRLAPSHRMGEHIYQSKHEKQRSTSLQPRALRYAIADQTPNSNPSPAQQISSYTGEHASSEKAVGHESQFPSDADDYEIVENQNNAVGVNPDINRKIMRSMHHGEQLLHVHNISRVRGLEAFESLLIIGHQNLYILADLLQRPNGEVVYIWQAPEEERDPYTRIISGHEQQQSYSTRVEGRRQSWPWTDVISISKRHFLFRDVAIELFLRDGRSYLLTAASLPIRNHIYVNLTARVAMSRAFLTAQNPNGALHWRMEQLENAKDDPQTVGEKLWFTISSTLPATARWVRGEMSNFSYLNYINTAAGRTFNDLTQYPIFPWILADYISEELDLSNPNVYRDLSKPMGCQSRQREKAFQDRYSTLAALSDRDTPPFHYGTHYSSAMIVSSYLIRLEPFVQSYLLLQGGSFDHPERLFHSVEKAWLSSSQESMSDVRELIPEFYFLPEFLENMNQFNFGTKSSNGAVVGDVVLPPWAKGDPHIFVAMQRKALESDYVSQNLHHWIDLIFGYKQRGEMAVDATNVFHHLSYHGAKNLDNIHDQHERLATIGIIHNFGQTPKQVFNRPHEKRQRVSPSNVDKFTRLFSDFKMLETKQLTKGSQVHRGAIKRNAGQSEIPHRQDILVRWANIDQSFRFINARDNSIIGVFEQLHHDRISTVAFAEANTLITASRDCTIGVWTIIEADGVPDLQLQTMLHGHRDPVVLLAVSKSLSTLVSCDETNRVFVWDINSLKPLRDFNAAHEAHILAINDYNGHIFIGSEGRLILYSINGKLMLDQDINDVKSEGCISCYFLQGTGISPPDEETVLVEYMDGTSILWLLALDSNHRWEFRPTEHL